MINESVHIERSPTTVWSFVTEPNRLPDWNPRAVAVSMLSSGGVRRGYRYQVTYRMRGRETVTINEVDVHAPPERFEVRVTGGMAPNGYAREIYTLRPTSSGTKLTLALDLSEAGIPWLWRLALSAIQRVGRPTGKRYLVQLKELIESSTPEEDPARPAR